MTTIDAMLRGLSRLRAELSEQVGSWLESPGNDTNWINGGSGSGWVPPPPQGDDHS
jgi:hypothetical protein